MAARYEYHHPLAGIGLGVETPVVVDARHHGDIGAIFDQVPEHRLGVAHGHGHPHAGIARDEGRQQTHDEIRPVGAGLEMAAAQLPRRRQQLVGLMLEIENSPGVLKQAIAQIGQGHPLAAAVQQVDAIGFLERPDLDRHRRLAHSE